MSGLLYNFGNFHAAGTEIHGKGLSEEQSTIGKEVTANGDSDTPAKHIVARATVLAAGKNVHGLSR
jgi:hypothetical protein